MDKKQVSDSLHCGMLLALSGGCMDAYSYLFRGNVFANAQTGNILLLGVKLAGGEGAAALKYLWPVLAFAAGILIADLARLKLQFKKLHWRQSAVLAELISLTIAAMMPQAWNQLSNGLISFACGIQVAAFRKIEGNAIATTMCIGNFTNGTHNLDRYFVTHEISYLRKAGMYFCLIAAFIAGAVIESMLLRFFSRLSLLLSVGLLSIVFIIMFRLSRE